MPGSSSLSAIVRSLSPDLKSVGFKRFGTRFNRESEEGLIHIVSFQGSMGGDRFTVNLGVYVVEIDKLLADWWGRAGKKGVPGRDTAVPEQVCWLRARLGRVGADGSDLWWSYDDPDAAAQSVRARLDDLEAFFAKARTRSDLLYWWRDPAHGPAPWRTEPGTPLGFALLLRDAEHVADARDAVKRVCADTLGMPFHHMVAVIAEDLGFECDDS